MDLREERQLAHDYVKALDVQAHSIHQEVQYLSGGNRQKVMLSKWLCRGVEVFLLDEPTQGVDVGAREEIHRIMKRLLDEGKGILMVSSDLDELMNMSHVIAVMNKGRIVATPRSGEDEQTGGSRVCHWHNRPPPRRQVG